jgi:excisionase family DNA binding protein
VQTLSLKQAAAFLQMSQSTLRDKVKAGLVPGAKPGKQWVFLEDDLVAYIRSLYAGVGQTPLSGSSEEKSLCHYTNAVIPGGYVSRHPVAAKYADLLELPTNEKPRSTTTI